MLLKNNNIKFLNICPNMSCINSKIKIKGVKNHEKNDKRRIKNNY